MSGAPPPPKDKSVIYLNSGTESACDVCGFGWNGWYDIGRKIQHYLDHGYKLLHVGSETDRVDEGLWHNTVAVMAIDEEK
jgi:hypothetical protein